MFEARELVARGLEDLERTLQQVLEVAQRSVWMSTALHPAFYGRESVSDVVKRAAERVKEFRLLIDGRVDPNERLMRLPWLRELIASGRIEARHAKGEVPHWIIVDDGAYMRLEKPHEIDEIGKRNVLIVIDADITLFLSDLVDILRRAVKRAFNEWWISADPVEVA